MRPNFTTDPLRRRLCMYSAHEPPIHMLYPPGTYKHTCAACGQVSRFTVGEVFW